MIRPYRDDDLETLVQIWLECSLAVHPEIPAEYWQRNMAATRQAIPQAKVLIYECQGQLCGYVGVDDGYVRGMSVAGNHSGKGIGTRLLRSAICKLGARRLHVFDQNKNALGFFRSQGFHVVDTHTDEETGALEHVMEFLE